MIAIIDYDAGNIRSVEKALKYLGEDAVITADRDTIMSADRAVLPGVGAFGDAMEKLRAGGLNKVIEEYVATGKPFLGICLGLQLIFEESEESPGVRGLGLLPGVVKRFPGGEGLTVPQIGWNDIDINPSSKLLSGLYTDNSEGTGSKPYVYFVHSYYLEAANPEDVAARTSYGITYDCAVESGNIYATQFHPEKSSDTGLRILQNFVSL